MKDVREIHDIPNIEDYLGHNFSFLMYEKGDNLLFFQCHICDGKKIVIDMTCEESLIEANHKLFDILSFEDIGYLSWSIVGTDFIKQQDYTIDSWDYRPLVDEKDKNY